MARILCGYDGSPSAARALRWAVDEARTHQSELTVLTVVPPPPNPPPTLTGRSMPQGDPELMREEVELARRQTAAAVSELTPGGDGNVGVPVEIEVIVGVPAAEILNRAERADLVVVGNRGAGGLARLLLGSVSNALVQHSPCPVLVARGGEG